MDVGSIVIGLGGLAVAGLSVYLSYKARTSPYREMLYSRQLEGCAEVVDALTKLFVAMTSSIMDQGWPLDESARREVNSATAEEFSTFYRVHQKWGIFLPREMSDAVSAFSSLLAKLLASPGLRQAFPTLMVETSDPVGLLADAYATVVKAARKSLGTEPLSQETLDLFRKMPEQLGGSKNGR